MTALATPPELHRTREAMLSDSQELYGGREPGRSWKAHRASNGGETEMKLMQSRGSAHAQKEKTLDAHRTDSVGEKIVKELVLP